MTTNINIRFEDWEAEQMKDPEFRAAVEELEPEYQTAREEINLGKPFSAEECRKKLEALRKKVANMEEWIAWRDEQLREAFEQIGVEWDPILLLPAVGYRRLVYEYNAGKQAGRDNAMRECIFCGLLMQFDPFAPQYVCDICTIYYGIR